MREILFRGKRKDNGEWVEGYFCGKDNETFFSPAKESAQIIDKDLLYWHEVIPSTVGQYTGLTDKNGKKIFEGDIVTGWFSHEKIIGYIFYGADASFFVQRDGLYGVFLNNASDWLKVIGNIHDNPELLKEGDDK